MKHLPYYLLAFALLCSCRQNSSNQRANQDFGFSEADEIEEFYDSEHNIKEPIFPGGKDSLRCYLAKNLRYNEELLDPESSNYLTIAYNVGPDCTITFPEDCIVGKEMWPASIELLFYNSNEELTYMINEAKRVIGNLKYKKPAMKRDSSSGEWLPTSVELLQTIFFTKDLEASLYNKDTIIAIMERFPDYASEDELQYRRFRQLTTDDEKIKLLKQSPSYEVKVNAAVGLIKSGNLAFEKYLPELLSDTTPIDISHSDVIQKTSVYLLFATILQQEKIDPEIRKRVENIIARRKIR